MEEAKAAIKDHTAKHGQHDTTVHEHHKPAVTHEHITPARHEEATTAIDREVHQEHHHTSVQPVHHREVLPEQHQHNIIPVEHKEHHHGDAKGVKDRLAAEAAQFKDASETGKTEHTHEAKPVVAGEHVHHHVHEHIQPVIQKETIQPTVIHSTIPVHEVHHNEPKHHAATALPAVSMADFKKQGGSLTGGADRTDHFQGEPQGETLAQHSKHGGIHQHGLTDRSAGGTAATGAATSGTRNQAGTAIGDQPLSATERERGLHGPGAGTAAAGAGGLGAGGVAATDARHHDRERDHRGPGAGTAAAGAGGLGAAGVGATDARHHDRATDKMDPRVDPRGVDSTPRYTESGAPQLGSATGTTSATDSAHHTGKLHKDPPHQQQYADTHVGSKMDTVGDRDRGIAATTGAGAGKDVNSPHHSSNFEAANVTNKTVSPTESSASGQQKKPSLLDRLNPLKDSDHDGKKGLMD